VPLQRCVYRGRVQGGIASGGFSRLGGLSQLDTDRPSIAEHDILSAEEETPKQLGARLQLMSDDMCDHPVMIALPPGPRARGPSPPATAIAAR
jgi:hypothetical protein